MRIQTEERVAEGDHFVHFFDTDEGLTEVVVSYLGAAVLAGETAVIIATPKHREMFEAALMTEGIDLAATIVDGRVVIRDAADTLARFTVDGRIDEAAFDAVVGELVRDAAVAGRPIRAYGEMVALLWDAGDIPGAMELERLWNQLGESISFSLFCAYPTHAFSSAPGAAGFPDVCHLHSHVIDGAPSSPGSDVTRRFAATADAPRLARRFVQETLVAWDRMQLADDALITVSELVANAIVHAGSDVAVGLTRLPGGVRVIVSDRSPLSPVVRAAASSALSGRGLSMINAITPCWGHEVVVGGKHVWVDLDAASPSA